MSFGRMSIQRRSVSSNPIQTLFSRSKKEKTSIIESSATVLTSVVLLRSAGHGVGAAGQIHHSYSGKCPLHKNVLATRSLFGMTARPCRNT